MKYDQVDVVYVFLFIKCIEKIKLSERSETSGYGRPVRNDRPGSTGSTIGSTDRRQIEIRRFQKGRNSNLKIGVTVVHGKLFRSVLLSGSENISLWSNYP
jgi:hypothetical protein